MPGCRAAGRRRTPPPQENRRSMDRVPTLPVLVAPGGVSVVTGLPGRSRWVTWSTWDKARRASSTGSEPRGCNPCRRWRSRKGRFAPEHAALQPTPALPPRTVGSDLPSSARAMRLPLYAGRDAPLRRHDRKLFRRPHDQPKRSHRGPCRQFSIRRQPPQGPGSRITARASFLATSNRAHAAAPRRVANS